MKTSKLEWLLVGLALLWACGGVDSSSASGDGGVCSDTWASYGQSFFASNCRSCHEHTAQFSTAASVQAQASSISSQISSGRMPEGFALSAAEKARILEFLSCGAN